MKINPINNAVEKVTYCFLIFCDKCGWGKHVVPDGTPVDIAVKMMMRPKECGCEGATYIKNPKYTENHE